MENYESLESILKIEETNLKAIRKMDVTFFGREAIPLIDSNNDVLKRFYKIPTRSDLYGLIETAWDSQCSLAGLYHSCDQLCRLNWASEDFEIRISSHSSFTLEEIARVWRVCYDQLSRKTSFDSYAPAEFWIRWLVIRYFFPQLDREAFPLDQNTDTFWGRKLEEALAFHTSPQETAQSHFLKRFSVEGLWRDINTIAALLTEDDSYWFLRSVEDNPLLRDFEPNNLEEVEATRLCEIAKTRLIAELSENLTSPDRKNIDCLDFFNPSAERNSPLVFDDSIEERSALLIENFSSFCLRLWSTLDQAESYPSSGDRHPMARNRRREMAEESAVFCTKAAYEFVVENFDTEMARKDRYTNGQFLYYSQWRKLRDIKKRIERFFKMD